MFFMAKNDPNLDYAYQCPSGGWSIRNALSHLFSDFDTYIAPAYHHDRCERSVQMRLYSMNKREFANVFIVFFTLLGVAIFIGLAGPPITQTVEINGMYLLPKSNDTNSLPNRKYLATGPYITKTPKMTTYNQQLWVIAQLTTKNADGEIVDKEFQIGVSISGLSEEHKPVEILYRGNQKNSTRHLKCDRQYCEGFIVMHLGALDYKHYIITVNFYGLESFHSRYIIDDIYFYFKTYNPEFTQIEVSFRLIFLMVTFTIMAWYLHTLKIYPMYCWSYEQQWLAFLLPLLMCFNNPFFPLIFLFSSWMPIMLDAMFQSTFLGVLLFFLLCVYHGLRQTERHLYVFYYPKLMLVGIMWGFYLGISILQKVRELSDPTYNYRADPDMNIYAVIYIFGFIYLVYLSYLILKAHTELGSMPYFGLRLKFLTLLMLAVVGITAVTITLKFGTAILQDNFVAQLSTHYNNSSEFMAFYGVLNLYVYTMAYVYSPGSKSSHDVGITRDHPPFSMINDSDEDVIYGSDAESRRPLNRGHNDDDSD